MSELFTVILYSSAAGITIIIGALVSHWLRDNKQFAESGAPQWVIALGGGSLCAPLSRRKNDWIPATGASLGYLLGIVGEKLL